MEGDRTFRPPRFRVELVARPECIPYLVEQIKRFLTVAGGLDERSDAVSQVRIALGELITNVVRHGYPDQEPGPLVVDLSMNDGCFTARLLDAGSPFDSTRKAELPDPSSLAEGGYGLGIVQTVMDEVLWKYVPGVGNELIVRKRLPVHTTTQERRR